VTYNGASYICVVGNTGVAPNTNASDWAIMDSPDAQGRRGLPARKARQVLKVQPDRKGPPVRSTSKTALRPSSGNT
jgi:hypothetical protein